MEPLWLMYALLMDRGKRGRIGACATLCAVRITADTHTHGIRINIGNNTIAGSRETEVRQAWEKGDDDICYTNIPNSLDDIIRCCCFVFGFARISASMCLIPNAPILICVSRCLLCTRIIFVFTGGVYIWYTYPISMQQNCCSFLSLQWMIQSKQKRSVRFTWNEFHALFSALRLNINIFVCFLSTHFWLLFVAIPFTTTTFRIEVFFF